MSKLAGLQDAFGKGLSIRTGGDASSRGSSPVRPASPVQIAVAVKTSGAAKAVPSMEQVARQSPEASYDSERGLLVTEKGLYSLGASVGKGSYGEILAAINPTLHRVVVKRIDMTQDMAGKSPAACDALMRQRSEEFHVMVKVKSTFRPLDIFRAGDVLFIVLRELRVPMDHQELGDTIDCQQKRPQAARAMLHDIADDLRRVHESGHLHRDLKLENYMVDKKGHVVLIDYGETRALRASQATLTDYDEDCAANMFAPETFLAWDASLCDERPGKRMDSRASEIFSLGLSWALAATRRGTHPFEHCPGAHEAWRLVHASLPITGEGDAARVDTTALAQSPEGEQYAKRLREFVLKMCQADPELGSYVALHVMHANPSMRPSAAQIRNFCATRFDDVRDGRACLAKPLASEAGKDALFDALRTAHAQHVADRNKLVPKQALAQVQ